MDHRERGDTAIRGGMTERTKLQWVESAGCTRQLTVVVGAM
ncbi:hypothetical protein [Halocatena salina]|nr:hypothetical protein [Halocatena salina]